VGVKIMLKKNRQIWSVLLLAVTTVTLAMSWLSWQALLLDQARENDRAETELARREAELQERISSALYRLDLKMLPLISAEAARPHQMYDPLFVFRHLNLESTREVSTASTQAAEPMELSQFRQRWQPAEFVNLHFQLDADGTIESPELPAVEWRQPITEQFGIDPVLFTKSEAQLNLAGQKFSYEDLLERCTTVSLPSTPSDQTPGNPVTVYNVPVVEKFQYEIETETYQQNQNIEDDNATSKYETQRLRGNRRINDEFSFRNNSTQQIAEQNRLNNGYGLSNNFTYGNNLEVANGASSPTFSDIIANQVGNLGADVRYGVMQPLWIDDQLLLVRQVEQSGQTTIQVCWLNWEAIQVALRAEIAALLPNVQFQPLTSDAELKIGTALTTIPVQLVIDSHSALANLAFDQEFSNQASGSGSGIKLALVIAWVGLVFAAIAATGLMLGVIRLSERRAAFVSSVTHELRTPLTTFRMYAEMLAEEMVPEDKRQSYANTLKTQADRLSHLVENVLQFARLERHPQSLTRETVTLRELFERFDNRLKERAGDAGFELQFQNELSDEVRLTTQVAAVEQILFNLIDNACKYAHPATRQLIDVLVSRRGGVLEIRVRDYGPGIAQADRKELFQPFRQSETATANQTGGVGLGLALCRRMAESIGGKLDNEPCTDGAVFVLALPVAASLG